MNNIFAALPDTVEKEVIEDLIHSETVRIERIISHGQSSPVTGWYEQDEQEWVIVLTGEGCLQFENGDDVIMKPGDYLFIPAYQRHRVVRTAKDEPTIWLAVFFQR